ncbi:MAG: hypothetical protein QME40_04600 [bacterium]|nr:hypothetical protein [bacterium]
MEEKKGADHKKGLILMIYTDLLVSIWKKTVVILGAVTVNALLEASIHHIGKIYSFLKDMEFDYDGIYPERIKYEEVSTDEIKKGFTALITNLFEEISELAGRSMAEQIKKEMERAHLPGGEE